jgi:glutamate-1-semialdehyde 2,1-aminomutase
MANGFSVAAVGGKREFMKVGSIEEPGAERTFLLSTTHGAEMPGMAAFIAAMQVYEDSAVVDHLWTYGEKLFEGLTSVARDAGVDGAFRLDGSAICMNYVTHDAQGQPSLAFRTLFAQEMVRHGVLMPWVAVSLAHGDSELNWTLDAARKALAVYAQALDSGIESFLEGPAIKPVFRRHN